MIIATDFNRSELPPALETEVNFDNVDFVSNNQLAAYLGETPATPEKVGTAVKINEDARLRACGRRS